jgi:hypothetical protein
LDIEANKENEEDFFKDLAVFGGNIKGKRRSCGTIGHKAQDYKKMMEITEIHKIALTAHRFWSQI